jgi:hypothetical protein
MNAGLRRCLDMKNSRLLTAIAALAALGACATATPYQAAHDGARGYTNQQIENDRWQVSFAGNSLTDRQTVETYLLYRAAELTDQNGFDHFRVVQRETEANRNVVPTGFGAYDPFYSGFHCNYRFYGRSGRLHGLPRRHLASSRLGFGSPFGYHDPFWGGYDYREIVRYEATSEIIMGKGPKPNDPEYFNADEVIMNLAGRIQRPEIG